MNTASKIEYTRRADGKWNKWELHRADIFGDYSHVEDCSNSNSYVQKIWILTGVFDWNVSLCDIEAK
jgi:hypothetical protein